LRESWREVNDAYLTGGLKIGPWPNQARFWLEWGSSMAGQSVPAARSCLRAVHSNLISARPTVFVVGEACSTAGPLEPFLPHSKFRKEREI
jgi:hypothetical protein